MTDMTVVYAQSPLTGGSGREPEYIMPLGCLYVTASLQRHGFDVEFRDYQFADSDTPQNPDHLARFLDGAADVVGVGCLVDFLPTVILALERFKQENPGTTLVLGGPGPSDSPEALLEAFPWIDVVVVGEGEITSVELLERLVGDGGRGLESVAGIVYRDGTRIVTNPPRPRIRDLDSLPFPHPLGVDLSRYTMANVMSSRGCPFECTFCDVTQLWNRTTTYRSVGDVLAELEALHRLGFRQVSLQDDNFTVHRKRIRELVSRAAGRDDLPRWSCLGRVDLVDRELLEAMRDGGCRGIFFGVESGSDAMLRGIMKKTTVAIARRAVEMSLDYLSVKSYFIWGFPDETLEDLSRTLLLMGYFDSLGAATPITLLAPLPQSILYRRHRGRLRLDERLFAFNFVSGLLHERNDRRVFDLVRAHGELFPSFYTYETPDVEDKLRLMERFQGLNNLELIRPRALAA